MDLVEGIGYGYIIILCLLGQATLAVIVHNGILKLREMLRDRQDVQKLESDRYQRALETKRAKKDTFAKQAGVDVKREEEQQGQSSISASFWSG